MSKLSREEIKFIAQCLREGKPLPESYRYIIPFETKQEYELTYDGKEREEDILADITFFTNEPDPALLDRFKKRLKDVNHFNSAP